MNYENIIVEKEDRHAFLILNRPEKRNALNDQTKQEIIDALEELEVDEDVRAIIITGKGDKSFIAGADVTEFEGRSPVEQLEHSQYPIVYDEIENCDKPVIAMINGYALGGGCEVALACDIRIASEKAVLGQPEIRLGIMPGGGGTRRLTELVGKGKAMQLIMSGDMIEAEEAKNIGLVEEVYPDDELREKTLEITKRITEKSPIAIKLCKKAIKAAEEAPLSVARDYEGTLFSLLFSTDDKEEGIEAFLNDREPEFKGK